MPINELEEHPFIQYYKQFDPVSPGYYKGIIIGSYPIYAITNSIDRNGNILDERMRPEASMRFFYGSKASQFWKYVGNALAEIDPRKIGGEYLPSAEASRQCAQLLFDNQLLLTDVLFRSNRWESSAEDSDLMITSEEKWVNEQKSLNKELISMLGNNKEISSIFFTSTMKVGKSPYGWFKQLLNQRLRIIKFFNVGKRPWSAIAEIDFGGTDIREYKLFFLPTPKTRGIYWSNKRLQMFADYIQTYFPDFFQEIDSINVEDHSLSQKARLSELRERFLMSCYEQALCQSNLNFNGNNLLSKNK